MDSPAHDIRSASRREARGIGMESCPIRTEHSPISRSDTRMKIIGIVGSRRRDRQSDYETVVRVLFTLYEKGDWIVSGGCYKGADKFAEQIAQKASIPMLVIEADWDRYGRSAGPIRNRDIAQYCDVLIALPSQDRTGGTESTIKYAEEFGKRVILC